MREIRTCSLSGGRRLARKRASSDPTISTNLNANQARRVGGHSLLLHGRSNARGGKDGRKKGACRLAGSSSKGRRLGSLRLLHGFGLGLRNRFLRGLRLLFGGELLLD